MTLNKFEQKQLEDANKHYSSGRGKSEDSERFERYFSCLKELKKFDIKANVLDVGCGLGTLEDYLFKYGFENVNAMDFSPVCINVLKEKYPLYDFSVGDAKEIDSIYADKKFDIIFCCQVLEHIPNDAIVLNNMWNLLNDDGLLIISVPFEFNKRSEAHCNFYSFDSWVSIGLSHFKTKPIVSERFGEGSIQLLVIFRKEIM